MKTLKTILLILLVFFIEVAIAPNLGIYSVFPSTMLIAIMFYLLNFKYEEALLWAGIGGILMDLYSPLHFGVYTFSYLVVYFISYLVFTKFISEQAFFVVIPSFFIGYLLAEIIPFMIEHGSYSIYFASALYTAILGTFVFYIFTNRFKKRTSTYELSSKL